MRIVIVGGGALAATTARMLGESGSEVVVIEKDAERVAVLRDELDCGLIHGDGTHPGILKEAEPTRADALLCLSGSDRDNLLAGVVGRHVGFARILTKIEDPEFESICIELGLGEALVPDRAIARALVDTVHGMPVPELAAVLGGEVRLFSFVLEEPVTVADLELPKRTRLLGASRDGRFLFLDEEAERALRKGDEVVLLTDVANLERLHARWLPGAG
jgi:trk system potassium uptake protein TrkA